MAKGCQFCHTTNSYICEDHCGMCPEHRGDEERERGFPGLTEEDYK